MMFAPLHVQIKENVFMPVCIRILVQKFRKPKYHPHAFLVLPQNLNINKQKQSIYLFILEFWHKHLQNQNTSKCRFSLYIYSQKPKNTHMPVLLRILVNIFDKSPIYLTNNIYMPVYFKILVQTSTKSTTKIHIPVLLIIFCMYPSQKHALSVHPGIFIFTFITSKKHLAACIIF